MTFLALSDGQAGERGLTSHLSASGAPASRNARQRGFRSDISWRPAWPGQCVSGAGAISLSSVRGRHLPFFCARTHSDPLASATLCLPYLPRSPARLPTLLPCLSAAPASALHLPRSSRLSTGRPQAAQHTVCRPPSPVPFPLSATRRPAEMHCTPEWESRTAREREAAAAAPASGAAGWLAPWGVGAACERGVLVQ
jgi:hypothetical protein